MPPVLGNATSKFCLATQPTSRVTVAAMAFTQLEEIELPAAFDAHVHLRDGEMSQLVTPTIRQGGVNQVYVMVSPIVTLTIFQCDFNVSAVLNGHR